MTQRDWQKDMEIMSNTSIIFGRSNGKTHLRETFKIADHWLREAKEQKARADTVEKRLKEMADILLEEAKLAEERGAEMHARELRAMVTTLYPDTALHKG